MNNKASADTLYKALLKLETVEECRKFLSDLCTIMEIESMSQRLLVAQLLNDNEVYSEIAKKTGASTATISRVARCLNHGAEGYTMMLARLEEDK